MCRLEGLIILYGAYVSMLSISFIEGVTDIEKLNCIFDWEYFATQGNTDDIIVDYSKQHVTTLQEKGKAYNYVIGPVTTKSDVGDSYNVFCEIQKYVDGGQREIVLNITKVCFFLENTYPLYLLPIGGTHNDFAPQNSICPMRAGTKHIYKAKTSKQLMSPSKLETGKYYLFVSFLKDLQPIGGISGNFTVIRN